MWAHKMLFMTLETLEETETIAYLLAWKLYLILNWHDMNERRIIR